ncbi:MAG: hypothetical protein VSS52_009445 [Thiotrichaceae bacterium]|nr:hypothetical protein [Thiotrichaceae bacterium]
MAILRCPHCQFLKEVSNQHLGKIASCPSCKQSAKVVDTVKLLKTVITKFQQAVEKNTNLKQDKIELQAILDQFMSIAQTDLEIPSDLKQGYAFENQEYAAVLNDFQPVVQWFKKRNIEIQPNVAASDISGYFDEVAVMLGDNLMLLEDLLDGIRYRQRKGYDKFTIQLNDYKEEDRKIVNNFCQMAYESAFFSKYYWNKHKDSIFLLLSDAPQIQHFFNGDWLEWYGFMKVATFLMAKDQKFACLRSSNIKFTAQNEQNELDIFFLINDKQPLWIECKSGEFRDSINKYQALRKSLNIDPNYAILLVSGLDDEKAAAMSSMFKLTIVNERTLLNYLSELF